MLSALKVYKRHQYRHIKTCHGTFHSAHYNKKLKDVTSNAELFQSLTQTTIVSCFGPNCIRFYQFTPNLRGHALGPISEALKSFYGCKTAANVEKCIFVCPDFKVQPRLDFYVGL